MLALSGNKVLSIEFLMLLILLLVIKTINASTLPSSSSVSSSSIILNELSRVNQNKCEQIKITNCPELKYNQTMISNADDDMVLSSKQMDEANELVSFLRI